MSAPIDTTFSSGVTITSPWLNGVNDHVNNIEADPHPIYAQDAQLAATTGSTLIGFIQNGIGAISQTVNTRLLQTISVKDFGAVGDGTTDDTIAILAATTDKLIIKNPIFANTAAGSSPFTGMGGTLAALSIASAGQLNIPATGEEFIITGTNGIGNIHEGWAGRQITLVFSGALTVVHGTGSSSSVKLNSATNFTTSVNSTLTLRHNGTQWYEIGRSV